MPTPCLAYINSNGSTGILPLCINWSIATIVPQDFFPRDNAPWSDFWSTKPPAKGKSEKKERIWEIFDCEAPLSRCFLACSILHGLPDTEFVNASQKKHRCYPKSQVCVHRFFKKHGFQWPLPPFCLSFAMKKMTWKLILKIPLMKDIMQKFGSLPIILVSSWKMDFLLWASMSEPKA